MDPGKISAGKVAGSQSDEYFPGDSRIGRRWCLLRESWYFNLNIRVLLADPNGGGTVLMWPVKKWAVLLWIYEVLMFDRSNFCFMGLRFCMIWTLELPVIVIPEKTTSTSDGATYTGIIREYISPIGGNNTLVVIDGEPSGLSVISISQSQIISMTRNFPIGSKVVFYWSRIDNQYAFRKSGSPHARKRGII